MQLASYEKGREELGQLGVSVIGATIEDREMAARMAEEEGRTFPIAYGVSEESVGPLAPVVQLDPSILLCGTNRAYAK